MERVLGDSGANRVEHEFIRDGLALLDGEKGIVQREQGRIATGFRHTSDESRSVYFASNK